VVAEQPAAAAVAAAAAKITMPVLRICELLARWVIRLVAIGTCGDYRARRARTCDRDRRSPESCDGR